MPAPSAADLAIIRAAAIAAALAAALEVAVASTELGRALTKLRRVGR